MTVLVREAMPAEFDTIGELTVAAYAVYAETGEHSECVDFVEAARANATNGPGAA